MVLTKELATLSVIAAAIGTPVSVIIMNEWLKSYAFHITLPWWIYIVAFAIIIIIGLLTVTRQIWHVIHISPINILRNE